MLKKLLKFKVALVMLLMLTLFCPAVFARGDDRGHYGGYRHYYHDGGWYRPGWFGFGIAVSALTIGALIMSLPPRHTTVIVGGVPYYYDNQYYYRQLSDGSYVVVEPPVVVQAASPVMVQTVPAVAEASTVNIPNSRGGFTSVTLRRSGNGYVGPQGEYYAQYPTVQQLQLMYGN